MSTVVAQPGTPEWYSARRTGIGASQAGAACGLSPYSSPLEVYFQCRGEVETEENSLMRFGRYIEPAIIALYQDEYNTSVTYPMPMARHEDWQFMLATPDAQESPEIGIETKSMSRHIAKQIDDQGLAEVVPHYVCQGQQQMAVMGWEIVRLVVLVERELRVFNLERDDELIEMIADQERKLWDRIQQGEPPPATKPTDLKLLKQLHRNVEVGSIIPLSPDISEFWATYEELGRQIREMQSQRDSLKAFVLSKIGDNEAGLLSDGERIVRRKIVERKGYTVEPSEVLDVRAVKYQGQPVTAEAIA